MINLLPPDYKQTLLYARKNTFLLKWLIFLAAGILGLGLIIAAGYIYLSQSVNTYAQRLEETRLQLEVQNLEETQSQVTNISESVQLVTQVLSKQVLFSKLLAQIGSSIPSGAVLTGINLTEVNGGIDLIFQARDLQTGSQIIVNLQDPNNQIFETADIENISCNNTTNSEYPCGVTVRALFGDSSSYLLIPKQGDSDD